jgi:hypothetical protein
VEVTLFDDYAYMPLDQLRDYLSELPNRYWGRGKIVSISEGGLRAPHTDDIIRRNLKQTVEIVESLGIEIKCRHGQIIATENRGTTQITPITFGDIFAPNFPRATSARHRCS